MVKVNEILEEFLAEYGEPSEIKKSGHDGEIEGWVFKENGKYREGKPGRVVFSFLGGDPARMARTEFYFENNKQRYDRDVPTVRLLAYNGTYMEQWVKDGKPHREDSLPSAIYHDADDGTNDFTYQFDGNPPESGPMGVTQNKNNEVIEERYPLHYSHIQGETGQDESGVTIIWYKNNKAIAEERLVNGELTIVEL